MTEVQIVILMWAYNVAERNRPVGRACGVVVTRVDAVVSGRRSPWLQTVSYSAG